MAISVVQSKSGTTTTGTVLTITLGTATTAGNCLVATVISGGTAITAQTLGGVTDHWATATSSPGTAGVGAILVDPNCAGSQTVIAITNLPSASALGATIYEVSGLVTTAVVDKSTHATTDAGPSTYNSGTTPTTSQASEIWFGSVGGFTLDFAGPPTLSGPAGWTLTPQLNWDTAVFQFSGYTVATSTGAAVFSGTDSSAPGDGGLSYIALVSTLLGATTVSITGTGSMAHAPFASTGTGTKLISGTGAMGMPQRGVTGTGKPEYTSLITTLGTGNMVPGIGRFGYLRPGYPVVTTVLISGTGSMAHAPFASSGTGTQLVSGTGSMAHAAFASSGTGVAPQPVSGTGSLAHAPFASTGSGTQLVSGTGSLAHAPFASTGSGTQLVSGTGSLAYAAFASSGSGVAPQPVSGTGSLAHAAFTSSGTGFAPPSVTGTGSMAMAPFGMLIFAGTGFFAFGSMGMASFGMAASGQSFSGTGSMGRAAFASVGAGVQLVSGTGSMTHAPLASSGSGSFPLPVSGTGSMAMAAFAMNGTGTQLVSGTGSLAYAAFASSGSGVAPQPVSGTGSLAHAAFTSSGTGFQGPADVGTGSLGRPSFGISATGSSGAFTGSGSLGRPSLGMTATGINTPYFPFVYVGDLPVYYLRYLDGYAATTLYAVPGQAYTLIATGGNVSDPPTPPDDGRWIVNGNFGPLVLGSFTSVPGEAVPGDERDPEPPTMDVGIGHHWWRPARIVQTLSARRRRMNQGK